MSYEIAKVKWDLVPCTVEASEEHQTEYNQCKSPKDFAVLARKILKRTNPDSSIPDPDFTASGIEMKIIHKIHEDFFLEYNPTFGNLLKSFRGSNQQNQKTPG